MHTLKWRIWARIVAYLDVIQFGIGLVIVLAAGLCTVWFLVAGNSPAPEMINSLPPEYLNILTTYAWIGLIVAAVFAILIYIQFKAARKLLKATELGGSLKKALGKSAYWRNVSLFFLIPPVAGGLYMGDFGSVISFIIERVIFLVIVYMFRSEVSSRIAKSPSSNPSSAPATTIIVNA